MIQNYIFGYGSLINPESRAKTGESGIAIPVRLWGVQRAWNLVAHAFQLTGVGATYKPSSYANGVIIPVSESELPKFDEREVRHGYKRVPVNRGNITMLVDGAVSSGNIWVYVTDSPGRPTEAAPIAQSYVDVVLSGCLSVDLQNHDIDNNFVREFVSTTEGWNSPWVNDRNQPRYPRPVDYSTAPINKIDRLLEGLVTDAFRQRK